MNLLSEASALSDYTSRLRQDFHKHPELGFQEFRTAGIVIDELSKLGLEVTSGVAGTGVLALIEGIHPGPTVLLRADMDALPIIEETGASYTSETPGVMHACGHDAHTAILLTVAQILNYHRKDFFGTIKLIFQPAEEGLGGAEKLVAEGVLHNPKVDYALALHVWNERPVGWIGISNGPSMAGGEIFKVRVIGRGGHGAAPHLAIDPILAASQIVVALQAISSRNVPPLQASVVTVCTIHGGEAFNVIPPLVEMTGTIRTFETSIRTKVLDRFKKTVSLVAEAMGCQVEVDIQRLTPAVVNDPQMAKLVQETVKTLLPNTMVDSSNYVTMGSEDMAYIMEKVPGCFIFIGSANPDKNLEASHHHPKFDIDESILPDAVAIMAQAALNILRM